MGHINYGGSYHTLQADLLAEVKQMVVEALEKDELLALELTDNSGHASHLMITRGVPISFHDWDGPGLNHLAE